MSFKAKTAKRPKFLRHQPSLTRQSLTSAYAGTEMVHVQRASRAAQGAGSLVDYVGRGISLLERWCDAPGLRRAPYNTLSNKVRER